MARKNSRRKTVKRMFSNHRKLFAALVILVLVLLVGGWALVNRHNNSSIPTNGNPVNPTKPYVNLSPPTSQDRQDAQNHKNDLSQTPSSSPPSTDGKKSVTPVITYADQSTINSYVNGVFEDGGTCTATITNTATSQVVTKTSLGFENASYTSCPPIKNLGLSSGTWQVVLSYSSSTSAGSSSPTTVKVP